jgi:hypothetical protein
MTDRQEVFDATGRSAGALAQWASSLPKDAAIETEVDGNGTWYCARWREPERKVIRFEELDVSPAGHRRFRVRGDSDFDLPPGTKFGMEYDPVFLCDMFVFEVEDQDG